MKHFITIASCASLFFLPGCGTAPIAPYQPPSASASERAAQESGVEVALDPFVESARTDKYFDINALKGIGILHVRVTNKTADKTFLVEKENIHLITNSAGGGMTADGKKIERSQTGATTTEMVGAGTAAIVPIAGSVLILTGIAEASKATEIQRNLTSKEMGDASLSPGRSIEGFIYFNRLPKGEDWSHAASVQMNLTDTKTHQLVALSIPLSH